MSETSEKKITILTFHVKISVIFFKWHLLLHKIWKKFIYIPIFLSCWKIKFCFVKLDLDSWKMCSIFGIYYFESKVHFYQSKNKYRCFSRMSMVGFVFQKYYVHILLRIQWANVAIFVISVLRYFSKQWYPKGPFRDCVLAVYVKLSSSRR